FILKQNTNNARRNNAHQNLEPCLPCFFFFLFCFLWRKRIQFMKVNQDNRENGSELDDNEEHFFKSSGSLQLDKFFNKNHVTRAADGKPFSNSLNNSQQNGFYNFNNSHM